ncbi:MAG: prolipoprotein diacylglyceryl transferase, partial [Candidatus Rokubacteria bacterium]|nr:prolipoprotein diacylglyceryl transferase [Candidatus Rokubacteria bacterium]
RSAGVIVIAALFAGAWLSARRLRQRALPGALAYDFVAPALLSGLVGARLAYALAFDPAWYLERPTELLAVWKGGFAEEGGFLGALVVAVWWCRRRGVGFWVFADAVAPGVALGQALARVGALLGGTGYGTPTTLPWAITFSDPNAVAPLGIPLHPTQAYEAVAGLLLAALLVLAERRTRPGQLFLLLVIGLALERGVFDLIRGDAIWITDWATSGQAAGAIIFAGALAFTLLSRHREG